jgi:hypothetical protein
MIKPFQWLSFAGICICLLVLTPPLNRPFIGHHEFNGVFYSQIARNYLRYGLVETRFAQVVNPGMIEPDQWSLHTHHPPTYPLLLAAVFMVFGESETNARMASLIAAIAGMLLIVIALNHKFKQPYLPVILLPLIATPLVRYYATLPVFEPLLLLGIGGLLHALIKKQSFSLLFFASYLMLLDWPGFWPVIILMVMSFVWPSARWVKKPLLLAIATATTILLGIQWLATGHPYRDLIRVGSYRLLSEPYTQLEWWLLLVHRIKAFVGLPLLVTIVLSCLWLIKYRKHHQDLFFLSLYSFLFGVAHILVFRNITWYHDYMLFHLIPFFIIASMVAYTMLKKHVSWLWLATFFLALTIGNWYATNTFYQALAAMAPHQDCVSLAKAVTAGEITSATVSTDKRSECPPFIYFYADQSLTLKVE